jgi:hypothetical protein
MQMDNKIVSDELAKLLIEKGVITARSSSRSCRKSVRVCGAF